ncbi:hypothetical protein [Pelagibacterium sp. H642]|uniref:hypothetical protein n=1 Tax=Pelagibacterium sp. H642 TaxID=1881069 RepID=UPI002814FB49|nr:hypothetical protein [Pelagibacterium sp. H642]
MALAGSGQKGGKFLWRENAGRDLFKGEVGHAGTIDFEPWLGALSERPGAGGGGKRQRDVSGITFWQSKTTCGSISAPHAAFRVPASS